MGFDVRGSDYSLDAVNEVNKHLEEIKYRHRVLKPGGSLLITFQSKRSPSYIKEEEVEPSIVVRRDGPETSIPHHFVDRNEVLEMLSGYSIVELNHVEHEYDELKSKSCHFTATATKA